VLRPTLIASAVLWIGLAGVAAPSAGAATTVGDSTTPSNLYFLPGAVAAPAGASVTAAGVVTSVQIQARANGTGAPFRVMMLRPAGGSNYTVTASVDLPVGNTNGALATFTAPVRFAALPGDVPAAYVPTTGASLLGGHSGLPANATLTSSAPSVGATLTLNPAGVDTAPALSVQVEADADADGYGDESQDACAYLSARHATPCVGDLTASLTAGAPTLTTGEVTTIAGQVTGVGAGIVATIALPAGLSPLLVTSTAGDCTGAGTYTCPVGELAAGSRATVYAVVRAAAAGAQTASLSVAADSAESNPADNAATVTLGVAAAPVLAPATPKLCVVPSLKGKTATAAKAALAKAGCAAGKITHPKAKRGRVSSQRIPAKVQVAAGTKVGFTLKTKK
jgi:hypothetical protein